MANEEVWTVWMREAPGHYTGLNGNAEVVRTGPRTWTLSWSLGLHDESRHRTLRSAQAHAEGL